MSSTINPDCDLTVARIIKAPRRTVWEAWIVPRNLEQWWLPEPYSCKDIELDLRSGGAFVTKMSENGADFTPHLNACFLAADEQERIVFTNALTSGFRPAAKHYPTPMTAVITLRDHPEGTEYLAHVMHKDAADRDTHKEMGFYDGWGQVIGQLAKLVERAS
jgi:uncharacterized protein YndB with AHSA1/START domain